MAPPYWLTYADFEEFCNHPDNLGRRFELIHGEIVEKVATEESHACFIRLHDALRDFLSSRKIGQVKYALRYKIPDDDYNLRLPDLEVSLYWRPMPDKVQDDVEPRMPDLTIEIQTLHAQTLDLREKALYPLKNGSLVVWLIFPAKRQVEIHTDESITTLSYEDTLSGGYMLPEFTLAVKDIFAD